MEMPVPYGFKVSVSIRRKGDNALVDVHAPMYMNKEWTMPHSYNASQFSDGQILRDSHFVSVLLKHYGEI